MPLFFPQQRASGSADTAVRRWRRKTPYLRARRMAACGGRECRCSPAGMPPSGGGDKRGQGHHMVPLPPLDSPKPSFAPRRPSVARRNGGTGARFRASGRFRDAVMTCIYFAWFAAHDSARPDGTGRQRSAAKNSASIKGVPLEHQTHLWAPRFLTRDRRESRPKERLGSQEGQGNLGVPAPFVSAGRPRHSPAAGRRPLSTPSEGVKSPPAAAPLYRRKVHRQQTVKKTARPPERRQVSPLCQGENLFYFSS